MPEPSVIVLFLREYSFQQVIYQRAANLCEVVGVEVYSSEPRRFREFFGTGGADGAAIVKHLERSEEIQDAAKKLGISSKKLLCSGVYLLGENVGYGPEFMRREFVECRIPLGDARRGRVLVVEVGTHGEGVLHTAVRDKRYYAPEIIRHENGAGGSRS